MKGEFVWNETLSSAPYVCDIVRLIAGILLVDGAEECMRQVRADSRLTISPLYGTLNEK